MTGFNAPDENIITVDSITIVLLAQGAQLKKIEVGMMNANQQTEKTKNIVNIVLVIFHILRYDFLLLCVLFFSLQNKSSFLLDLKEIVHGFFC